VIVPLIGTGLKSKSAVASAQRRINAYLEPQVDTDKTALMVYGTPGLTQVLDMGASVFRGGITEGDLLYLIQNSVFYEVNNAFVTTDRNAAARMTTVAGRTNWASSGTVMVGADGTNGYNYTISTTTFAQIGSAMFAKPVTVTYQDGYFLASFDETGTNKKRCQISADGVTWNALDYRAIDTTPGALIRTLSFNGEVNQFSDKGVEFWAYTGDPTFPFAPIRGATVAVGLAARWSIGIGPGSLYFLGRDRSGSSCKRLRARGAPDPPDLDARPDARAQHVRHARRRHRVRGQHRRALDLRALVPDRRQDVDVRRLRLADPERAGVDRAAVGNNGGRHYSDQHFSLVNKSYVSDYQLGRLYRVDEDVYSDNGTNIPWEMDTRHFFKDYDRVTVDALVADFETGVGNAVAPGDDPQVMLQISRDGGRTWGAEMMLSLGKVGEYKKRVEQRRLGTARDFVFKLRITDPVKRALTGLGLRATPQVN
jgi:hypothetical protein